MNSRTLFSARPHPSPVAVLLVALFTPFTPFAGAAPADEEAHDEKEETEVSTDATDLPAVLKSISELEKLLTDGVSTNNSRALRALQEAAASPKAAMEFYLEAKKAVDFEATGRSDADWRKWRDANEAENRETANAAARQFQLRYLILCLQATSGPPAERAETMKKVLPLLVPYLDDLAEKFPKLESGQQIVTGSALDSVFARYLKLDLTLDRKAGWPTSAADVPGIYERIILPAFREERDPKMLLAAWDKRIAHEAAMLRNARPGGGGGIGGLDLGRLRRGGGRDAERALDKEESRLENEGEKMFREVRLPELQWQKERDGLLFGADRATAYARLTQHLRAHLDHPSAQDWLDELKNLADGTYGQKKKDEARGG